MSDDIGVLRPPWYWRLAYRLLFRRLPAEYGPWVAADLTRPGWPIRVTLTKYLNTLLLAAAGMLIWHRATGRWGMVFFLFGGLLLALLPFEYVRSLRRPVTSRKEILDHQGIDKEGRPVPRKGRLELLRNRFLPRRDIEAVAYFVVVILGMSTLAAWGLSRSPKPKAVPKPKKCVTVTDEMKAAILATLEDGAKLDRMAARKDKDGIAVIALAQFDNSAKDPKKPTPPAFAVWFLRAEGRGYQATGVSSFPTTTVKTTAPKVDVGFAGEKYEAASGALQCVTISR